MTNKKTILGVSFAAAFAVSMIFAQSASAEDPLALNSASVVPLDPNGNSYLYFWDPANPLPRVSNDVTVDIPLVGVGVAFVNLETGEFTGATIHPPARDNRQHSTGWHPHTGTAASIGDLEGLDFCITSLNSPHAGMSNTEDTFRMTMNSDDATIAPGEWSHAIVFDLIIDDENCEDELTPDLKGGDGWGSGIKQIGPKLPPLKVVVTEILEFPGP